MNRIKLSDDASNFAVGTTIRYHADPWHVRAWRRLVRFVKRQKQPTITAIDEETGTITISD